METDLIISKLNELHKSANIALENKDVTASTMDFGADFYYTQADGIKMNKADYQIYLEKYFRSIKKIESSYYRIKSAYENEILTEKIARKSVIIKSNLLGFSKKQTIQTEEIYHWKNINDAWKTVAVEIVLEERY